MNYGIHYSAQSLCERTYGLADLMLRASNKELFVTCMVADSNRVINGLAAGYAGGAPDKPSGAWHYGPSKAFELLATLDPAVELALTPTSGYENGCGYMGGIRFTHKNDVHNITSGSAWSQECDLLFAAMLNYAMEWEVRFHHFGVRHSTKEDMLGAVSALTESLMIDPVEMPAEDHERFFFKVPAPTAPNGSYLLEQSFHPENRTPGIHWDVATSYPQGLLRFIAKTFGTPPTLWDPEPNSPEGLVSQTDGDGIETAIMVRPRWDKFPYS
jgi:hypothetical protein